MNQPVMAKAIIISLSGRRKGSVFLALVMADLRRPIAASLVENILNNAHFTRHPPKAP